MDLFIESPEQIHERMERARAVSQRRGTVQRGADHGGAQAAQATQADGCSSFEVSESWRGPLWGSEGQARDSCGAASTGVLRGCEDAAAKARRDGAYSLEQDTYRAELAFDRKRSRRRKVLSAARVLALVVLVPAILVVVFVASYILTCILNGATPDDVVELLQGLWMRVEGFAHDVLSGL